MNKLTMHTPNLADENYKKLAALFPNAVTETVDEATGEVVPVDDVCASLAASVADVLATKAMRGCAQYGSDTLIVGGGFSANSQLRAALLEQGERHGVDVRLPERALCTDNGAMVAMLGANLVEAGVRPSPLDFPIDSAMPLTRISM